MKKKVISLFLTAMLGVSMLAGCGSSEESVVSDSSAADTESGDAVEITLYAMSLGTTDGVAEVEDAINAITEEAIGVHVNLNLMDSSSYMSQISLMMSGGDTIDLLQITPLSNVSFNVCQAQNQLMDISELVSEYAPEMEETVGEYLAAMEVDGGLYGVPGYRLLNSDMYVYMRSDILEELDLLEEAEAADSWSDLEAIFEQVYAAMDSLPEELQVTSLISNSGGSGDIITLQPALAGDDDWSSATGYDTLGDSYYLIGVDDETDTVFSWYESEDFQNEIALVKSWYEKGYVYLDAATSDDTGDTNIANGIAFCNVAFSEPGVEQSKESATGYDLVVTKISSGPVTTGSARSWGWAVPTTASEPEAAVEFLNLMYTNEEIVNLLVYGIEGRDYELNEEGEAVVLDDASYTNNDFMWGNQFLAYPAEGQGGDFRETSLAEMVEAGISKYYGCSVDTDSISNELTAISNVVSQYYPSLVSGSTTDLEGDYEAFISALYDAGLDVVIETYQTALDEWLAEQE